MELRFGHGLADEAEVGIAVLDGEADVGRVHGQRHAAARASFGLAVGPQRLPLVERLAAGAAPLVVAAAVPLQPAHPHLFIYLSSLLPGREGHCIVLGDMCQLT